MSEIIIAKTAFQVHETKDLEDWPFQERYGYLQIIVDPNKDEIKTSYTSASFVLSALVQAGTSSTIGYEISLPVLNQKQILTEIISFENKAGRKPNTFFQYETRALFANEKRFEMAKIIQGRCAYEMHNTKKGLSYKRALSYMYNLAFADLAEEISKLTELSEPPYEVRQLPVYLESNIEHLDSVLKSKLSEEHARPAIRAYKKHLEGVGDKFFYELRDQKIQK